jgi:hypothetical protein
VQATGSTQRFEQPSKDGSTAAWTAPQAGGMPHPGFPQGRLDLPVCEKLADSLLGQDEGLKNLMMSWYYAGYYTAQYEAQQRKNQNGTRS